MIMSIWQPVLAKGDVFSTVSAGTWYSVAIKTDGSLWTWGSNGFGQLGDGTNEDKNTPVKIMDGVSAVEAGSWHTMAIKMDGSLWAWGRNVSGQLGDGSNDNVNAPIKIMDDVLAVSAGDEHTIVIKTDGSLWAWGGNSDGQLGDGTNDDKSKPTKIMDAVSYISAGGSHSMAIKTDNTLWAWGWNINGQLGDGSIQAKNTPIKVMDNVSIVSAGFAYTMAVTKDNSLWTWASYNGQIISTANPYPKTPTKIMDDVLDVSTGTGYSMIIKTDGSLWAWGANKSGQLGDGTYEAKDTPVKIMDDVSAVSCEYHSLAIKTDGSLWSWGSNENGELGDGTNDAKNIPIKIMEDTMLSSNTPIASTPQDSIKVLLNGVELSFDVPPQLINDRTMLPMRAIFEAFGCTVEWEGDTQTVTVRRAAPGAKHIETIIIQIDNPVITVNNVEITLDVPAQLVNERTLVPVRAVAEGLGADVLWYDETQTVLICDRIPPYTNAENLTYKEISASENWIYWSIGDGIPGVLRAHEDGSDCEWVLKGIASNDLIVSDNYLYGRLSPRNDGLPADLYLRSYNIETKEFKDLSNQNVRAILKNGDWIEYSTFDTNGGIIDTKRYKVKIDGSETVEIDPPLPDYVLNKNPIGSWVNKRIEYKDSVFYAVADYISERNPLTPIGICRTDKYGNLISLFEEDKIVSNIVVINDTIFFTKEEHGYNDNDLYRMDLDEKYKIKIAEHITQDFKVIGNYIYFYRHTPLPDNGYHNIEPLWRIRTDGTNSETLVDAWKIPDWDPSVMVSIG